RRLQWRPWYWCRRTLQYAIGFKGYVLTHQARRPIKTTTASDSIGRRRFCFAALQNRLAGKEKPRLSGRGFSLVFDEYVRQDMCVKGRSCSLRGNGGGTRPAVLLLITSLNALRNAIISSGVPTVMRTCVGQAGQIRPM